MTCSVLRIEQLRTDSELDRLRDAWDALYRSDPHATVFLSWSWLRAYLPTGRYRWFVLALRDGDALIAVLPLALSGFPTASISLDRELHMGANPAGDYTGMLCMPGREHDAIEAFAAQIAAQGWENFNAVDTRDPRIEPLARRIAALLGGTFEAAGAEETCLIALPASWDAYLGGLEKATRKKTLRAMRQTEALPDYRFTEASAQTLDAHLDAVFALKHARYGGRLQRWRARYTQFFRAAYGAGTLRVFVVWQGSRPVSAAAVFVDRATGTFSPYMRGHDSAFDRLGPGRALSAVLIRTAIEEGYRTFDFLRGDYSYKRSFSNAVAPLRHFRVTRPGLRARVVNVARPVFFSLKLRLANIAFGR